MSRRPRTRTPSISPRGRSLREALEQPGADYQITSGSQVSMMDRLYFLSTTSDGRKPGRLPPGHHDDAPPRFSLGGDPDGGEPWRWRPEEELTPEEEAVMQLVAAGKTQLAIADALGISEKQARRRWERGRDKLRARTERRARQLEQG